VVAACSVATCFLPWCRRASPTPDFLLELSQKNSPPGWVGVQARGQMGAVSMLTLLQLLSWHINNTQ
jgi:hypothetical protein